MSTVTVTRVSSQGGTIHVFVRPDKQILLPRLGLLRPSDEVFLTLDEYDDPGVREAVITAEDIVRQREEEALQEAIDREGLRKGLLSEIDDDETEGEEDEHARGPGSIKGVKDRMIGGKKRGGFSRGE